MQAPSEPIGQRGDPHVFVLARQRERRLSAPGRRGLLVPEGGARCSVSAKALQRSMRLSRQELHMTMTRAAGAAHCTVVHVQGSGQAWRSVAYIVAGHGAASALLHGKTGLSAIRRLYLRLLIAAHHDGLVRWIKLQADDAGQLLIKARVRGELECPISCAAADRAPSRCVPLWSG